MDDVENLDTYRIMRIDVMAHWLLCNIFHYWNIIIEQQQDEDKEWTKTFHFIPEPYRLLSMIKTQRDRIIEERKKKYIFTESPKEEKVEK